jgi:hypothetical protein
MYVYAHMYVYARGPARSVGPSQMKYMGDVP